MYVLRIWLTLLVVLLAGCDGMDRIDEPDLVYKIKTATVSQSDLEKLRSRYSNYPVSFFSSVTIDQADRSIIFSSGSPDERLVRYFAANRGKLIVYGLDRGEPWISDDHILQASASSGEGNYSVRFSLNEEGAQRLASFTAENIGNKATVEIDGKIYMQPIIADQLSKRFMITMDSAEQARRIATLLQYGSLEQSISLRRVSKR